MSERNQAAHTPEATMTVTDLRKLLEGLEAEGKGGLPVLMLDSTDESPAPFGLGIWADAVVCDYTTEEGTIWRNEAVPVGAA